MSSTAIFEHSYYIGNYMSAILYGVELAMYYATVHSCNLSRAKDRFFALYSTILLILLTIDISTNAFWGEQMWITFRDAPGGPPAFIAHDLSVWYQIVGSTSVVVLIFMGDAFLLYRCYILWRSDYRIIALPVLIYFASFALAIVELVGAYTPGGNFFQGRALIFGTTYYSMTISLNIVLTLLICGRLIYFSRLMRAAFGNEQGAAKLYSGIAAMLAESAAPYTLVGIMFLIPYAQQSPTANVFGQLYAKFACLSPQLIVLRVAQGRTWEKDTVRNAETSVSLGWHRRRNGVSVPFNGTQLTDIPSSTKVNVTKASCSSYDVTTV
ncbi:hypothetical protein JB92DRAFT_2820741 [Gautieria morchelliformis]|nr:hypothetical protein JB92DRAFT_2820741 [Gautieria morchelliformis]